MLVDFGRLRDGTFLFKFCVHENVCIVNTYLPASTYICPNIIQNYTLCRKVGLFPTYWRDNVILCLYTQNSVCIVNQASYKVWHYVEGLSQKIFKIIYGPFILKLFPQSTCLCYISGAPVLWFMIIAADKRITIVVVCCITVLVHVYILGASLWCF